MNKNDIKKLLYKQCPEARLVSIDKSGINYQSVLFDKDKPFMVSFTIPFNDLGDAKFTDREDAKLLIRWLLIREDVNYVLD